MNFRLASSEVTHATFTQESTRRLESTSFGDHSSPLFACLDKGTQRTEAAEPQETFKVSPLEGGFSERIFDARVVLKRALGTYAMYLADDERQRVFDRLDILLSEASWYEDDPFPTETSFRAFLKWMVHAENRGWSSIGSDAAGNILVAWVSGKNVMTAQFSGQVHWTTSVLEDGDKQTSAGSWSLDYFAHNAASLMAQIGWR